MSLRNAFAYLTALRIPPRTRVPLAQSFHYFPWIGAAIGSLNILCFLAASRVLPVPLACLVAVLLPQALGGFSPLRGAMQATQGLRTHPGHELATGFRPETRAWILATALLLLKWGALLLMTHDWRTRAAFVFPILGMAARTAAFLLDARGHRLGGRLGFRRRVRAAFLSAASLFLAFLFPPGVALGILAAGSIAAWTTLRARGGGTGDHPTRLTFQTAALVSEVTEVSVLAAVAVATFLR